MNFPYIDLAPTSGMPPTLLWDRDPAGKLLQNLLDGRLPDNWDRFFESFPADPKGLATRQSSSACLNYVSKGAQKWSCWMVGSLNIEDPHPNWEKKREK